MSLNKMSKFKLYLLIFYLFFIGSGLASVKIESFLDKNMISVGDRVTYTVRFIYSDSIKINLPDVGSNLGQFEIKDHHEKEVYKNESNQFVKEYTYIITPWVSGTFIIPSLDFSYSTKEQENVILKSNEHRLEAKSLLKEDDQDIRDINGPHSIPYKYLPWVIAAIVFIVLIGLFIWLYYYYRDKNKFKMRNSGEEEIAPEIQARQLIKEAEDHYLNEDLECKNFYIQLSYAIRKYLERKFNILALEESGSSTAIIIEKDMRFDEKQTLFLADFLRETDMVKFAKFFHDYDRRKKLIDNSYEFINQTSVYQIDAEYETETETEAQIQTQTTDKNHEMVQQQKRNLLENPTHEKDDQGEVKGV